MTVDQEYVVRCRSRRFLACRETERDATTRNATGSTSEARLTASNARRPQERYSAVHQGACGANRMGAEHTLTRGNHRTVQRLRPYGGQRGGRSHTAITRKTSASPGLETRVVRPLGTLTACRDTSSQVCSTHVVMLMSATVFTRTQSPDHLGQQRTVSREASISPRWTWATVQPD